MFFCKMTSKLSFGSRSERTMPTTAFLLEIITLASIIVASSSLPSVPFPFPRCVKCPCGSGSQEYTHCIDVSMLEDFTCERWSQCQTCKANITSCITCPPDRFGPTCSENDPAGRGRQDDPHLLNRPSYPRPSVSCSFLEQPKSGSIRCSQTGNERYCTSRCLPGYHFEGEQNVNEMTLRCRGNVWTPRTFFPPCVSGGRCEVKMSGAGFYNCTIDMEGTHCDITCDARPQGTFHCYPGRQWNPPLPFCAVPKEVEMQGGGTCEDPGIPRDGSRLNPDGSDAFDSRRFQEGETAIFSCNDGFGLTGSSIITCLADRTWSSPLPQCVSFRADPPAEVIQLCPLVEVNPNVEVEELFAVDHQKYQGFEPGEELTFRCKVGHDLEGPSVIECLRNGRWSSPAPTCNPKSRATNSGMTSQIRCENPGHIPNGRVDVFPPFDDPAQPSADEDDFDFPLGTHLKFRCEYGYRLVGKDSMNCESNGYWSGYKPLCARDR